MHVMLAKAAVFIRTKSVLAVLGAVLVAGGGSAVALAATHGNPGQLLSGFAAPTHTAHDTPQDDQGDHASAEGTLTTYVAPSGGSLGSVTIKQADGTSVTFTVNDDTRVNGTHANALADLPGVVGSRVQVQAQKQTDGSELATKITVQGSTNSVELHGVIASVNVAGHSFVLTTADSSVTIAVTGDTKFSHDSGGLAGLRIGAQVNVQGVKQPSGSVIASHIEVGGGTDPHGDQTPEATESTGD